MSYELIYTHRAVKDINKLDPFVKKVISKSIIKLKTNPFLYSEKLTDPKVGSYRFRVGDYRVIFDIKNKDVIVLRVGHRREVYKRA